MDMIGQLIEPVLWVLFIFACLIVSGVILLQEGKGGGLGEAFGGAGQQTFGVKAAGINKFTGYVAVTVLVLAILITIVREGAGVVGDDAGAPPPPPALPGTVDGAGGAGGADGGGGTDAGGGGGDDGQ